MYFENHWYRCILRIIDIDVFWESLIPMYFENHWYRCILRIIDTDVFWESLIPMYFENHWYRCTFRIENHSDTDVFWEESMYWYRCILRNARKWCRLLLFLFPLNYVAWDAKGNRFNGVRKKVKEIVSVRNVWAIILKGFFLSLLTWHQQNLLNLNLFKKHILKWYSSDFDCSIATNHCNLHVT